MAASDPAVTSAAAVARAGADDAEHLRRLPAPTVAALGDAGLFTMCLPEAYGGAGAGPLGMIDAVQEVAEADGSAGWCAGIASTTSSLASFLAPEVARKVFPSTATATGGVFAPNAVGRRDGGGYRVSGRWQWGSGTQHCEWIVGGARCDDGSQRVCFFTPDQITFHDTWHTSGLRGTGSLDFSVDDVFVPTEFTYAVGDRAVLDEPISRFPNFTLLALGIAATGLGIGRRALDECADLAGVKKPQYSTRSLAESSFAQTEFARAEVAWRSARALLRAEVGATWDAAVEGEPVGIEARVAMRLAAAHVASTCVGVVDTAWTLAGGTAVYDSSVLGRCVRDAHVVTQHIMVAPKLNETLGKFLLGVEFNASMI
jgi:alkylation response protein AidB-like acyl-CoA dehydrogenase